MILIYPSRIYHDIGLHKPKLCPSIFLGEIPSSQLDLLLKLPLKDLSFYLFFFKPEHDIIVHVARTLALQLAIVRHTIKSKRWVRIISASWGKWLPTNYSKVESTILKRNLLEWNKGNFFGFNNWTIFCFSNPAAWDISQWGWPFSFCQFCIPFARLKGHLGAVTSVVYRKKHCHIISAGKDGMIHIWDSSLADKEREIGRASCRERVSSPV